ncbi:hypothetical protein CHH83_20950 [Bacillus sp. 7586-K]|nr:hypothetical protein CHH83_20950 [Bacillus sp. 7586-K]
MQTVFIQVHYDVNGMKALRRGDFKVNPYKYKMDPDKTAAEVAEQFVRQVKRESNVKIEIVKVLYNEVDITELVND